MNDPKISDEVRKFIRSNVESIGPLEILALLLKDRKRAWTTEDLRTALHSSTQAVEQNLWQLIKMDAVTLDASSYCYSPTDEKTDKILNDLNSYYMTFPTRIIEIIYNKTDQSLRDFSDANCLSYSYHSRWAKK